MEVECSKVEGMKVGLQSKESPAIQQIVVWAVSFIPVSGPRIPIRIVFADKAQADKYVIGTIYLLGLSAK